MPPIKAGMKKTIKDPNESITPFAFIAFFLVLAKVTIIPDNNPINNAGNGFGKTLELAP